MKTLLLVMATGCGFNSLFAQTWTQTSALNTNWYFAASSADGTKVFAPGGNLTRNSMYVSTNSGTTWAPATTPFTNSQYNVAVSADGKTVFASRAPLSGTDTFANNTNPLYLSTDSGAAWTTIIRAKTDYLWSVAMSADAKTLVSGAFSGWVFISTNMGAAWSSNRLAPTYTLPIVVVSADGRRISALVGSGICTTTNSGLTWITNNLPSVPNQCYAIAASADGAKLAAVGQYNNSGMYVCTSTNAGASWNLPTLVAAGGSDTMTTVGSSADGTKLMVAAYKSLYFSTNSGVTWAHTTAPSTNWNALIPCADGNRWIATVYGKASTTIATGGIWKLQMMPSPQLNLSPAATDLTLAWTVPSTNFVLQQSADLTAWADVTNTPTLNLANLQNQVTLTPTNGSGFYRLKTP